MGKNDAISMRNVEEILPFLPSPAIFTVLRSLPNYFNKLILVL